MKCTTIEEALKNYSEVTNLYLSGDECKKAFTDEIEKLTNLKSLHFSPKLKEWSSFPKGFKKLNIDVLHITGVRVNELIGMKLKHLSISLASIDFLPLCKNISDIEELTLLFAEEFSIPKEIEQLSKLKKLSIGKGTLVNVADEIANLNELNILNLQSLGFKEFPLAFTKISNLKELSLKSFSKLTTLPKEIKNWKKLKSIYFQDCFKNREEMNFEDELFHKDAPIELPSAIAELKSLQKFETSFCPIKNLNSLAELTNLEEIKIVQGDLENIDVLENLINLKKLDINCSYKISSIASLATLTSLKHLDVGNTKITDLKALSKLTSLEYLNVKKCPFDKSKPKLKNALLPIYTFENLKILKASKITQEEWEKRDRNEVSKKKTTPEEIIKFLENKNSSLIELEKAINAINDIETVFNVSKHDVDDSTLAIEILDTAVSNNISKLSDETLQKIISFSFSDQSMSDSYEVTIIAVNEIIKRKSIKGQEHVVKAFLNCCEYYDAGHRFYGATVQDQLIDDLFPNFELAPLVELILNVEDSLLHPEYGDNMSPLYAHAFSKMSDTSNYEPLLIAHLTSFVFENITEESIIEMLDEILESEIMESSKKIIETLKNTASVTNAGLKGESVTYFEKMLQEVDKSIPFNIFANFDLEEVFKELPLHEVSYNNLQNIFTSLISSEETSINQATTQTVKVLFLLDESKLKDYLIDSSNKSETIKQRLINILKVGVSKTEEDYINKNLYKEFAVTNRYLLLGKSEEDIKKELAEKKAILLKKELAAKQKNELNEAFNKSLKKVDNDFFINESQEIISNELLSDYSFDMASFTTKLLINSLQHGDFISAKNVVLNYAEKLLPIVGPSHKQDDVASNAIVLAIMAKDEDVSSLVFEKILPKDFKATDISNEILAFNLSCFYAYNKDKKRMLPMIKQSLNLGKNPKQFKTDTDFSVFWEDQDFIEVLNS